MHLPKYFNIEENLLVQHKYLSAMLLIIDVQYISTLIAVLLLKQKINKVSVSSVYGG